MALPASRFLRPQALAAIRDLSLVARVVVEGFLAGEHPSRRHGAGVEFDQYRSYQPGDDPRRVDWRLYARSDRFFVRESEIERDVTLRLVLDRSASMGHQHGPVGKFDYARYLAASLAYLAWQQGDRFLLQEVPEAAEPSPPAGRRLAPVLRHLEAVDAAGAWPPGEVQLAAGALARRERQLVVFLTDLWEAGDEIRRGAALFRTLGHEVLVLHLVAPDELTLNHGGDVLFEDLESGETVRAATESIRGDYLRRLDDHLAACRAAFAGVGVGYELLPTDQPLDRALRSVLLRRRFLP